MARHKGTNHKSEEQTYEAHHFRDKDSRSKQSYLEEPVEGLVPTLDSPFRPWVQEHAALLARAQSNEQRAQLVMQLQQTYGNAYVQRLLNSKFVQAKPIVNPPDDVYEREADRAAESIHLQAEEEELQMQPGERQPANVCKDLETQINRARSGGQPLDSTAQNQMSASLGYDFSGVRVHTGPESDELNKQLRAKAFTTGPDIFFKRGAYDPASSSGQELIAHELSHVVQQSTGRVSGSGSGMTVRPAGDALEQEADALANQAASSGPAGQGQDVQRNGRIRASTRNEGSTANTGIEDTDTLTAVVKIRAEKQLVQRNGTKWEQYTWLFNPNEPIPIMTGNEYADWIEHGGKEPTSMNCWQALLYSAYTTGKIGYKVLRGIHVSCKLQALQAIPVETFEGAPKKWAIEFDKHYNNALQRRINFQKWRLWNWERRDEEIPAGHIIGIKEGAAFSHWAISDGGFLEGGLYKLHPVSDLWESQKAGVLGKTTLEARVFGGAIGQFEYNAETEQGMKNELKKKKVLHAEPFWEILARS